MTSDIIMSTVKNVFQYVFNCDDISLSSATCQDEVEDWDSIGHIRLLSSLEEEFNLTIPLEDTVKFNSIKDIVVYLEEKIS